MRINYAGTGYVTHMAYYIYCNPDHQNPLLGGFEG
jgi:hypothetical protein